MIILVHAYYETFVQAAWDEGIENLEAVRRENKNLADEIKDLLDQLGEGGKSIHELDRQRRRLQVEKDELQAALEEAESALEQEENKVVRASLELQQVSGVHLSFFSYCHCKFKRLSKRLTEEFKRKKKSLKIQGKIIKEPLTPCKPLLKQKSKVSKRHCG